jgi:hypothetical protein
VIAMREKPTRRSGQNRAAPGRVLDRSIDRSVRREISG